MGTSSRFDFKKLDVYRAAVEYYEWCLDVASRIPPDRKVVTWQMLRAALSIMLNVAEAGGRRRPGEVAQYLRVARGSAYESAAVLDALMAMGVLDEAEWSNREELLARIGSMLSAMIRRKSAART